MKLTRRGLFALLLAPFLPKQQPLPFLFVESYDLSRNAYILNNGLAISNSVTGWLKYGDFAHLSYYSGGRLCDFCFWFGSEESLRNRLLL